jgi:hypothetical protein
MSFTFRPPARAWIVAPLCALLVTVWFDAARLKRAEYVSGVAREGADVDVSSPTGYAGGKRWLIVPEHNNPTYQWIEETQQMIARGGWRVRSVDYENAPLGREVGSASPYRWWLVLVAWVDHAVSGRPIGLSVERAALYSDPLLHALLLLSATVFAARRFGTLSASLVSLGIASVFPLASAYLPGVANDFGLAQAVAFWSVLLLAGGLVSNRHVSRWYFASGVAGGIGLWVSVSDGAPIVAGIGLGALLAAVAGRVTAGAKNPEGPAIPPWRAWAAGGAVTSLLAYLVEYFPSHMDFQLRTNYPLYGIAWLGLGELLWRFAAWMQAGKLSMGWREAGAWIVAAAAFASLPVAIFLAGTHIFLSSDLLVFRLTNLPGGIVANSLAAWIARDGVPGAVAATLAPVLLLGPALWMLSRRRTGPAYRAALAIGLGPVAVALALACQQIRWWNAFDGMLLALVAVAAASASASRAANPGYGRWMWAALGLLAMVPGLVQLAPAAGADPADFKFTRAEVEGLYERALSQWIADHAGPEGAVVLVPPYRTPSFCFYGGLRGIGTPNWENRDGLSATFRIINSTRPDETLALLGQRGVTHIVVPSWDKDFDDFARIGLTQPKDSFIYALHQTDGGIFPWLRALPYEVPAIAGFEEQSVLVLQVTDEADPATVRSRLVEYLVEMHQVSQAVHSSEGLRRYPGNLGALVALAQVEKANGDDDEFAKVFSALVSNLSTGSDRSLPWDRRVSLAVVLALGGRSDLSRDQVERCIASADDADIRYLSTGSLYHLLVLAKHFDLELPDGRLRALSLKLLPDELRERL